MNEPTKQELRDAEIRQDIWFTVGNVLGIASLPFTIVFLMTQSWPFTIPTLMCMTGQFLIMLLKGRIEQNLK